jgi:hypothetical protein
MTTQNPEASSSTQAAVVPATVQPQPQFYTLDGDRNEYSDTFSSAGDWMGRTTYEEYVAAQKKTEYVF